MVGVCRLGPEELARVKDHFGCRYATEDCELDAVIVSLPHTRHHEHARAALEAGLHVLCQKPRARWAAPRAYNSSPQRLPRKKRVSTCPHSAARMPGMTSG